jgi:hypothetical protein
VVLSNGTLPWKSLATEIIGWPAAIAAATLALMCSNWALRSGWACAFVCLAIDCQTEKPAVGRYKGETHARASAEDQPTADIITVTHYCAGNDRSLSKLTGPLAIGTMRGAIPLWCFDAPASGSAFPWHVPPRHKNALHRPAIRSALTQFRPVGRATIADRGHFRPFL